MISEVLTINNKLGLHARPAALFVQIAQKFKSDVKITKNGVSGGEVVDGKSIMGLLSLSAERGSKLHIEISGEDENDLFEAIKSIFMRKFDEE